MQSHQSEKEKTSGQETLVVLIRVAQEDAGMKRQLLAILRQPPFHRRSLLNTMIAEMRMKKAPADFVAAITRLLDDDVARCAVDALGR